MLSPSSDTDSNCWKNLTFRKYSPTPFYLDTDQQSSTFSDIYWRAFLRNLNNQSAGTFDHIPTFYFIILWSSFGSGFCGCYSLCASLFALRPMIRSKIYHYFSSISIRESVLVHRNFSSPHLHTITQLLVPKFVTRWYSVDIFLFPPIRLIHTQHWSSRRQR